MFGIESIPVMDDAPNMNRRRAVRYLTVFIRRKWSTKLLTEAVEATRTNDRSRNMPSHVRLRVIEWAVGLIHHNIRGYSNVVCRSLTSITALHKIGERFDVTISIGIVDFVDHHVCAQLPTIGILGHADGRVRGFGGVLSFGDRRICRSKSGRDVNDADSGQRQLTAREHDHPPLGKQIGTGNLAVSDGPLVMCNPDQGDCRHDPYTERDLSYGQEPSPTDPSPLTIQP